MPATRSDAIYVIGVSMTRFGRYNDRDAYDLGAEASLLALDDAEVTMGDVDVLAAGSVNQARQYPAQQVQKRIGQTGIPAFNVLNACATGATAVRVVHQAILAGEASIGLAVGCEQMGKMGLLGPAAIDVPSTFQPSGRYGQVMSTEGIVGTAGMPGVFAQAGTDYAGRYDGVGFEQFAKVAEKNHSHSALNPLSMYRKVYSL